jgi:hypothetical protein
LRGLAKIQSVRLHAQARLRRGDLLTVSAPSEQNQSEKDECSRPDWQTRNHDRYGQCGLFN